MSRASKPADTYSGTDGSNPVCSSGESDANLIFEDEAVSADRVPSLSARISRLYSATATVITRDLNIGDAQYPRSAVFHVARAASVDATVNEFGAPRVLRPAGAP